MITASGECPGWYISPFIQQDLYLGGLKFSLRSYAGGYNPPPTKYFDVEHKLRLHLPNNVVNSKSIIFVTANVPNGFVIPIKYTGCGPEEASQPLVDLSSNDAPGQQIEGNVSPTIPIIIQEGKPFHITASFGPDDVVDVKFDPNVLKMVNASINQKNIIVWEFEATKLGRTLVEVNTIIFFPPPRYGIASRVQYYDVSVVLHEGVNGSESKVA